MATSAFPALAINTQGESPLNMLGKIEQIKSAQQSQEMAGIQIQEARVAQQSRETLMSLFAKNNGDFNQTYADAQSSGKVTPNDLISFRTSSVALQTQAAKLTETQLANTEKTQGLLANGIEEFKALPLEQRTPAALAEIAGRYGQQGVDISKFQPALQSLAKDPSDTNIRNLEIGFKGEQWVLSNEKAQREAASAPTVSQAQQKTKLELDKLSAEALNAQRLFENQPTPLEAKTERDTKLKLENAEIAKTYVETAKAKFDMFMKQNEPVEGTNAAGFREVRTRADSKGLSQVTELNNDQYNKESMLSARFGQVAQNLGKYEAAIRQAGPVTHIDDMAQVIADQALGNEAGLLHAIPSGKLLASKEVSKVTADSWNNLTPDERKLAMAYLQVKGGIITYNKAVDDTGRANETALSLEAANIPSPLEDKTVALNRIQGNKDNLKTILPAVPHFSHMPDPMQYLQAGENVPINQTPPQTPLSNLGPRIPLSEATR